MRVTAFKANDIQPIDLRPSDFSLEDDARTKNSDVSKVVFHPLQVDLM